MAMLGRLPRADDELPLVLADMRLPTLTFHEIRNPAVIVTGRRRVSCGSADAVLHRGFTLMEMLVTLVILSMISTLLWQALQQMAAMERLLQSTGAQSQLLMIRREWIRNLIETALPEKQNAAVVFQGDGRALKLASAETFNLPRLGVGALQLSLRHDPSQRHNRITLAPMQSEGFDALASTVEMPSITLLSWTGEPARFSYQDRTGKWHDEWPVPQALVKRLPSSVKIDLGDEAGGTLHIAVSANALPMPRRLDWERQ